MKPDVQAVLRDLSMRVVTEIAPRIEPAYYAGTVRWLGMIFGILADEWDRAAHRLVEENRALRALFAEAAPALAERELAVRLERLSREAEPDLRLSTLTAANEALRGALIELHVAVEGREDPASRGIEASIWRELVMSTEWRNLSLAPF